VRWVKRGHRERTPFRRQCANLSLRLASGRLALGSGEVGETLISFVRTRSNVVLCSANQATVRCKNPEMVPEVLLASTSTNVMRE
jgi:hypothetical protein